MIKLFLVFIFLISGCSVTVRDISYTKQDERLHVKCESPIYTILRYCSTNKAYSNLVQTGSKVKITNLETGKGITIAVYRDNNINGVCVPDKYSSLLGKAPAKAKLEILRCGIDGITTCPPYIRGYASWYGEPYHGRYSSYGQVYDMYGFYVASRDLPLGTLLRVKNLKNGKEVEVKVIDRGPLKPERILDLSYAAAQRLDMLKEGVVEVEAKVLRCGE